MVEHAVGGCSVHGTGRIKVEVPMGSQAATSDRLDTRPLLADFGVEIVGIDVKSADRRNLK